MTGEKSEDRTKAWIERIKNPGSHSPSDSGTDGSGNWLFSGPGGGAGPGGGGSLPWGGGGGGTGGSGGGSSPWGRPPEEPDGPWIIGDPPEDEPEFPWGFGGKPWDAPEDPSKVLNEGLVEAIEGLVGAAEQGYTVDWSGDYPVILDSEGQVIRDFSQYGDQLQELKDMDIPSMQEFAQNQGVDYGQLNSDMQSVSEMLTDPGQQALDEQGARDYFDRLAGITDGQYMEDLLNQVDAGVSAQPGLSDDERGAYQEAVDRQVNQLEQTGDRQLDSVMGSYGSQSRGLAAAEQVRQQIGDARVQGELQIIQEDQARRQYNFESKRDQYNQMLQAGQITQQQYMEGLRADRLGALQGYASQMESLTRGFGAEIEGLRSHADIMYNTLMTDLGISQSAVDFASNWFDSQIQPYLAQVQAYTAGVTAMGNQNLQEALDEILADE